jgi:hypothetical protein
MRQYGSVPPVLSTATWPGVSATAGLGTGGGAGVQPKGGVGGGQGQFTVRITTGSNPSAGGSVTLSFPAPLPPVLFIAGSDGFGTISAPNNDGAHAAFTIAWTATLPPNAEALLHCEWASSH